MSTQAFKALLIREIEQAMRRIDPPTAPVDVYEDGKLDAYAHVLQLIKEDL